MLGWLVQRSEPDVDAVDGESSRNVRLRPGGPRVERLTASRDGIETQIVRNSGACRKPHRPHSNCFGNVSSVLGASDADIHSSHSSESSGPRTAADSIRGEGPPFRRRRRVGPRGQHPSCARRTHHHPADAGLGGQRARRSRPSGTPPARASDTTRLQARIRHGFKPGAGAAEDDAGEGKDSTYGITVGWSGQAARDAARRLPQQSLRDRALHRDAGAGVLIR